MASRSSSAKLEPVRAGSGFCGSQLMALECARSKVLPGGVWD